MKTEFRLRQLEEGHATVLLEVKSLRTADIDNRIWQAQVAGSLKTIKWMLGVGMPVITAIFVMMWKYNLDMIIRLGDK